MSADDARQGPPEDAQDPRALDAALLAFRAAAARGDAARAAEIEAALAAVHPAAALLARAAEAADREAPHEVIDALGAARGVPHAWRAPLVIALGHALASVGQLEAAMGFARGRLTEAPDDAAAALLQARVLALASPSAPEGPAALQAALAANPQSAVALRALGNHRVRLGRLDEALPLLERAAAASPLAVGPQLDLARLYQAAGQPQAGVALLRGLLAAGPRPPDPARLAALAELQAAADDGPGLAATLRELSARAPVDVDRDLALGLLWAELGDAAALRALADSSPSPGAAALLRGMAALHSGADPLPELAEAAVALPEHWLPHEQRAQALLARGDLPGAEAAAAEARRRGAGQPQVRVTAALVDLAAGREDQALPLLRAAAAHPGLPASARRRAAAALPPG